MLGAWAWTALTHDTATAMKSSRREAIKTAHRMLVEAGDDATLATLARGAREILAAGGPPPPPPLLPLSAEQRKRMPPPPISEIRVNPASYKVTGVIVASATPVATLPAVAAQRPRESRPRRRSVTSTAGARRGPPRDDDEPPPPGACEVCGASLEGKYSNAVTCSPRCRVALHRRKPPTPPPAVLPPAIPEHEKLVIAEISAGRLSPEDGLLWTVFPEACRAAAMVRVGQVAA
jgi:hypothetical protein